MQIKTQRLKIKTLQNSDLNDVFDIYKNENSLEKDLSYRMQSINFGINIHL